MYSHLLKPTKEIPLTISGSTSEGCILKLNDVNGMCVSMFESSLNLDP